MGVMSAMALHGHYTALHGYAKIIRFMQVMANCRYPTDFFLWMALYCPPEGKIMPSLSIKRYVVSLLPIH